MAKDSFSNLVNNIAGNVSSSLAGKPQSVIDKLAGGDRASAISILLGQEQTDAGPDDWRVRLSCAPLADYLYKDNTNSLLSPLRITDGCVWPYTPEVTMAYSAAYAKTEPTHSNYPIHTYKNSEVSTISITGDFTAQTPNEARYVLACMMFLRASTKMFWGDDPQAGQPPPILYLNGYGHHFFPNVPVVVTNYTANLPGDPDYVEAFVRDARLDNSDTKFDQAKVGKFLTRIPATVTMTVTVEPVYSRIKVANEFTFEKFSKGQLISGPGNKRGPGRSNGGFV
jgi:hypothetical protein